MPPGSAAASVERRLLAFSPVSRRPSQAASRHAVPVASLSRKWVRRAAAATARKALISGRVGCATLWLCLRCERRQGTVQSETERLLTRLPPDLLEQGCAAALGRDACASGVPVATAFARVQISWPAGIEEQWVITYPHRRTVPGSDGPRGACRHRPLHRRRPRLLPPLRRVERIPRRRQQRRALPISSGGADPR